MKLSFHPRHGANTISYQRMGIEKSKRNWLQTQLQGRKAFESPELVDPNPCGIAVVTDKVSR